MQFRSKRFNAIGGERTNLSRLFLSRLLMPLSIAGMLLVTTGFTSGALFAQGPGGAGEGGAEAGFGAPVENVTRTQDRERPKHSSMHSNQTTDRMRKPDRDRTRDRLDTRMMDRGHEMQSRMEALEQAENNRERLTIMAKSMEMMSAQMKEMHKMMGRQGMGAGAMEQKHLNMMTQQMHQMTERMRQMERDMERGTEQETEQ